MNETIGVKGGYNDRRRSLKIKKEQKRKLLEYFEEKKIKELERDVHKKQIYTFIKSIPIIVTGGIIHTFSKTAEEKKVHDKEEEGSRWRIKEFNTDMSPKSIEEEEKEQKKKIIVLNGSKKIIVNPIQQEEIENKNVINEPTSHQKQDEENHSKFNDEIKDDSGNSKFSFVSEIPQFRKPLSSEKKPMPLEQDYSLASHLDEQTKDNQMKADTIVREFSKRLKEIRYDLHQLILEYNTLVDEEEVIVFSEEAEIILDKLSEIIEKIELLEKKIQIEDLDKYDEEYIYQMVEKYIHEFKNKEFAEEIKDSPLYLLISKKIDEFHSVKDGFSDSVDEKKEMFKERENQFELLKEQYHSIEMISKALDEFQKDQELILKEIQEKVSKAVTIEEKVKVEAQMMNQQSRRLLRLFTRAMLFPGFRVRKGLLLSAGAYAYFMRQLVQPSTTTKRYRVVTVADYSQDIQNNLSTIDDATELLEKTSDRIDKMIMDIKNQFQDYLGLLPECDSLLLNLEKIKNQLKENESEIDDIKEQQEHLLKKNNEKVLTRGEYLM